MQVLFEVAAVALIILATVTLVFLAFLIAILKNVRDISGLVRSEVELIKSDIDRAREGLAKEGLKFKGLLDLFMGSFGSKGRRMKRDKNGEDK